MAGQGITSKAAFKIETSTYGTSIACGASDQINIISESVSPSINQAQSVHLRGQAAAKTLYPITKKYGGELMIEAHYSALESLIACALGMSHQNKSPVTTSTGVYCHYFEPSDDLSGRAFNGYEMTTPSGNVYRRGTLCLEKDVSIWEYVSSMVDGFTMEISPERVTFTFKMVPYGLAFDSGTNNSSASYSFPSGNNQVLWDDMILYLKTRDKFTITSSNDAISIYEAASNALDIADGTYTGYELAQALALAATNNATLTGIYQCEYDEEQKRFRLYTTNGVTFYVVGAVTELAATMGFTVSGTAALQQISNEDAIPDALAAFAVGDKVGVSKITLNFENVLDTESQDSTTALQITEPERNGFRRITGTLEIPRYKNDTFLKAVNGFTTYEGWINFIGAAINSQSYQFNMYLPAIKFVTTGAPIAGPDIIKQSLAFEAQVPENFPDLVNYMFGAYNWSQTAAAAGSITCLGVYKDGLYGGDAAGRIMKWNGTSWSTDCDFGTHILYSICQYQNDLFVGCDSGRIMKKTDSTGGTWSANTDVGAPDIEDMAVYGGYLYALEEATGRVIKYNAGTSWSSSCDTTANDGMRLITYGDSLWMLGTDGATFTRVYRYNGSTWSTSCSIAVAGTRGSMEVHRGKLYVSYNQALMQWNGTRWTTVAATGQDIKHMISMNGVLLFFTDSATSDVFYLEQKTATLVNLYSALNIDARNMKPALYEGSLFIPNATTQPSIYRPPKDILITIQNITSGNPL